jgi:hypothetical protein
MASQQIVKSSPTTFRDKGEMQMRHRKLNLTQFLAITLVLALGGPLLTPRPAFAEKFDNPVPIAYNLTAISTDTALLVYHIGVAAEPSGKVAVAANGDLTFTVGAFGAEAADTTFECPVSGALGGIIDVSDTACDTMGEVADVINASTYWRAALVSSLRSDSSNDTLVTIAATDANARDGLALKFDDAVNFQNSIALIPPAYGTTAPSIQQWLGGSNTNRRFLKNPWNGTRTRLSYETATTTYGSGTSAFNVYSVKQTFNPANGKGTEVATLIFTKAAGATTVAATNDFTASNAIAPLTGMDEKLIVRVTNSAAMSAATHYASGIMYTYK